MNEKKILVYDKNQMSFLTFFQEKIAENEYDVSDFCSFLTRKSQAVRRFLYSSSLQFFSLFFMSFRTV